MASTVLQAYLPSTLNTVSTILLMSDSIDHPLAHLDHCCHPISLSNRFTVYYVSIQLPPGDSLWVVGQKLLQTESVFPLGVGWVPPAAREMDPRVVLSQPGHIPWVCHQLEWKKKKTTSTVQVFVFQWDLAVYKSLHRRGFTDYFRGFITSVIEVIKWCSPPKNIPYPVISVFT